MMTDLGRGRGARGDGDRFRRPYRGRCPRRQVAQHTRDAFLERHEWLPTETARDLADVGPGAVWFARTLRHVNDRPTDQLDESVDRLWIARAQIEDFARVLRARGHEKRLRDVGDVHEIAPLGAIADDRHRPAVRLLRQEDAEDRAVRARR